MNFRFLPALISLSIIGLVSIVWYANYGVTNNNSQLHAKEQSIFQQDHIWESGRDTSYNDTFVIAAVGDIMLGTNFPSPKFLHPNPQELLNPVLKPLISAHLTIGNLEGTILDSGGTAKKCKDTSICYLFRMNELSATVLKNAGFDVLNLANNHSGDFGREGRTNTELVLAKNGISTCGLVTKPSTIINRRGRKIGFVGFAPNTGTVYINDSARAIALIDSLRSLCDLLIVTVHGGAEGRGHQHVTRKHEFFYGEDRGDVYHFARNCIDAGADIILGHGPHVPRAVDIYKGKFIAYSMGNFCTYARFSLSGENAYAPLFKIYVDKKGNFLQARVLSYIQLGEGGPVNDKKNKAFATIKTLTKTDIPEAALTFSKYGFIYPKKK